MNRRQVLGAAGVTLTGALAGCLDLIWGENPTVPGGMSVETHYTVNRLLETGLSGLHNEIDSYHTVITDHLTAQERLAPVKAEDGGQPTADPVARAFIENTDFDRSYIVIMQYGMPSGMSLELERIERIASGIEVTVRTESPNGVEDDFAVHSKIIQITDEEAEVPEDVSAYIDNEPTDASDV